MRISALEAVTAALNQAGVRYLIVGGLAVNAHGYVRLTTDIDLVIALDADNILRAFHALHEIGYRPRVPITAQGFADADQRRCWQEEKGMQVLSFFSDQQRTADVDVFVYEPFDFATEYENSLKDELSPGLEVRFATIPTLIRMKEIANRPKDIDDIQHLRWILEDESQNE